MGQLEQLMHVCIQYIVLKKQYALHKTLWYSRNMKKHAMQYSTKTSKTGDIIQRP